MNELLPGFGQIVQRVWDGETDEEALATELKAMHDSELKLLIEASVGQLCQCTLKLQEDHGPPDAANCVDRKNLVKSVMAISRASEVVQKMQEQPHWQ
jgi:hypothetical protein